MTQKRPARLIAHPLTRFCSDGAPVEAAIGRILIDCSREAAAPPLDTSCVHVLQSPSFLVFVSFPWLAPTYLRFQLHESSFSATSTVAHLAQGVLNCMLGCCSWDLDGVQGEWRHLSMLSIQLPSCCGRGCTCGIHLPSPPFSVVPRPCGA